MDVDKENTNHPPVEKDYPKHQQDPGPSPEAVYEKDKDGAGKMIKWIIPVLVIVLIIAWFLIK